MIRLKDKYKKQVITAMQEKFGYKSIMAVPRIEKVVANTGFGRQVSGKSAEEQKKIQEWILDDLSLICGQKAILTRARKDISGFKLRRGMVVGARVTLRGRKMYDFLERVIHIVLPRSRDFRGIEPRSFDQQGNLNIPIREHIDFPEISPEKIKQIFGFEITIVTNAKSGAESLELFRLMGFPVKT